MSYDSYQPEDLSKGKMDSNVKGTRGKTRLHRPAAQPTQSSQQPQIPQGTPTGQFSSQGGYVAMSSDLSNSYNPNPSGYPPPPPNGYPPAASQQAPLDFDSQTEDLSKGKLGSNVKGGGGQPRPSTQLPRGNSTGQTYPSHVNYVAMSGNHSNNHNANPSGYSPPLPNGYPPSTSQEPFNSDSQPLDYSKGRIGSNVVGGGGQTRPSPHPNQPHQPLPQIPRGNSTGQTYPAHESYAALSGNPTNNYQQSPSAFPSPPFPNTYPSPSTGYSPTGFNTNPAGGSSPQGSSYPGHNTQVPPLPPTMAGPVGGFAINPQPPRTHFQPQQASYYPTQHTGGPYPPQPQTGSYPSQGSYSVANPYSPRNNTPNGGYDPQSGGFFPGPRPPTY